MAKISTNIKRILKYGFLNFARNGFVSLAAVLIMTIALFMISASMYADAALKSVLNTLKEQVDVNVYMLPDAPEEKILKLKQDLQNRPEVQSVEYIPKEKVLENFKKRHEDDKLTIQSLEELGENPFGASLAIKAKDPGQYESIAAFIKNSPFAGSDKIIDKVNFVDSKRAIDALSSLIKASQKIGLVVISFLIFVAVLIVFNTIRLAVYTNKEEISVMKLVGASDWYVQGPFVVSGMLYGLFASLLTLALLYPLSIWLSEPSRSFLLSFDTFDYFVSNFTTIASLTVFVGLLLGTVSSYLSVRRYLDV